MENKQPDSQQGPPPDIAEKLAALERASARAESNPSLVGNKAEVMQQLLAELKKEFWVSCKQINPEHHQKYFDTKYENFRQTCPTVYRKAMEGGLDNTIEFDRIMSGARDIASGRRTKEDLDGEYAEWMTRKYRIAERYGNNQGRATKNQQDMKWLLGNKV